MTRSLITALLIALVAAGWVLSGQIDLFTGGPDTAAAVDDGAPDAAAEAARPFAVRVRDSVAAKRALQVVVRGRTEAVRAVDVRAEARGRVAAVAVAEGQRVAAGEVLVHLATEDRKARQAEMRALVRQRELEYEAARALSKKGFRAETQLAGAMAALDASRAALKRIEVEIEHLVIGAPFAGVVEARHVELGGFLDIGDPVARLVDIDPILLIGQVAERDIGKLQIGAVGRAELIDGSVVEGRVRFIATTAQRETRTFRVELEAPNPTHRLRDGITADIRFQAETVPAHFVSPALLTLDNQGRIGVRAVDAAGKVTFWPAEVIGDAADGVWLTGLPERLTLITVGQEFVRAGDKVRTVREAAEPTS